MDAGTKRLRTEPVSSNSDSEGENDTSKRMKLTEYMVEPTNPFFAQDRLNTYSAKYKENKSAMAMLADTVTALHALKTRFSKQSVKRMHYTQFVYKSNKMPHVIVATNAYGLNINKSDNFANPTVISTIKHLTPSHRVNLLLPTVDHWWHEPSKALMTAFIERIISDMKNLGSVEGFKQAIANRQIKVMHRLGELRKKYLNAVKVLKPNDPPSPAVFSVKVHNSMDKPSVITPQLGLIKPDGNLKEGKWSDLIRPTYMQAVLIIRCRGIKLLKENITIDLELVNMVYCKLERQAVTKAIVDNCFAIPGMEPADEEESSNDDENASTVSTLPDVDWGE